MDIRIIGAALVGTAAVLAGCGADTAAAPPAAPTPKVTPPPAPTPTVTPPPAPTPMASDEGMIRDVIAQVSAAHGTSDFAKVAPLTCAKYRDLAYEPLPQSVQFELGKIENVVVNGDTATADVTLVIDTGGEMDYTADPSQFTLVKEDGQWKDCTPRGE